jgi:hypothetical protein
MKVYFFGAFGNLKNYLHLREKQRQKKKEVERGVT